jgi:hypothetical protein
VPRRELAASADEYVEWHAFVLWVRTIDEAIGLKNLFGTIPGSVYGWPKTFFIGRNRYWKGIDQSILDINGTMLAFCHRGRHRRDGR